jgi:uncharacterized tellurite resistance protein B-like protein
MADDRNDQHFMEEVYGAAYEVPHEVMEVYGRILLCIAAGDGIVSVEEWHYFNGRAKTLGIPDFIVAKWKAEYETANLEQDVATLRRYMKGPVYAFLYDAIKIAAADGYADGEKRMLRRAAAACDVPETIVRQLENLVALEDTVRTLRVTLLFPEATPFHDPKRFHPTY